MHARPIAVVSSIAIPAAQASCYRKFMQTRTLRANQIFQPGEAFHFTRTVLSRDPIRALHNHDYYELFWLQHGRAKHLINDTRQKLTEGDMLFIRPADCHGLQGQGDETHLVNIVFPAKLIAAIFERHPLNQRFFWANATLPAQVRRNSRQLADLSHRALQLEAGPRTALSAEAFLLALLAELANQAPQLPGDVPDWLVSACTAAHQPEVFRQGAAGLVQASGRAHAHVSRTFQRYFSETPSDYVNRIRMEYAARALTGSSDDLAQIATDCGVSNLSHFHRLFRDHHGTTPNQFRRQFQKNVVQII